MSKSLNLIAALGVIASSLIGCGKTSSSGFRQPPDTDVTSLPEYNFSSLAGTTWKTRVKTALADVKHYTGEHVLDIFSPEAFDPSHPQYNPVRDMRVIAVLPVGTCIRIEHLMKDNGNWGGLRVSATLEDGLYSQKAAYLDNMLLAKNRFIWIGWSSSTNWGVNPDMLEASTNAASKPIPDK